MRSRPHEDNGAILVFWLVMLVASAALGIWTGDWRLFGLIAVGPPALALFWFIFFKVTGWPPKR